MKFSSVIAKALSTKFDLKTAGTKNVLNSIFLDINCMVGSTYLKQSLEQYLAFDNNYQNISNPGLKYGLILKKWQSAYKIIKM